MPEGHTIHRIARQFRLDYAGRTVAASSPQGRFAAGARLLDGRTLLDARAVGKHLFLEFDDGHVLRVHLGLYGAWDLYGQVTPVTEGQVAVGSMGAPRLRRAVRLGEDESERDPVGLAAPFSVGAGPAGPPPDDGPFPPPPVGQVRVRLATEATVADLRGPSACEVLDASEAAAVVARLGPDPATETDLDAAGEEVVRRVTGRGVAIGQLLMDQSVVSGIGNIYRAELLFRARLDPWTPGRHVPADVVRALWRDWVELLADGIRTGVMLTREDLGDAGRARALADPTERHWVYGRAGLPCRVCGTPVVVEEMAARKLYRCPVCQLQPGE